MHKKIQITLVTGFLGAGKTTFLKNYINQHKEDDILYIINEFASLDVDGQILAETEDNVLAISGGSIFCTCLVADFISVLQDVKKSVQLKNIERVVIEASGMANPKVIVDMLKETKLDDDFEVELIVSIIDSNSFIKLVHTLPNIIMQVEAADIVFINKTDIHSNELVASAYAKIKDLNPVVNIIKTEHGKFDNSQLCICSNSRDELHGEFAKCKDPNYEKHIIEQKDITTVDDLKSKISNFPNKVYRAKGYFKVDEKIFRLEYEGNNICITEETSKDKQLGIVVITDGK
jgi:G3E family GTPase